MEEMKRPRFVSGGDKTTSFHFYFIFKYITKRRRLGISGPKRRRFEAAVTNPNDIENDVVLV